MTLQEAYDKLCTEFIKSEKTSHLCRKDLNVVKTEKANLLVKQDETTKLVETLVMENTSLEEVVKNLEVELSQARTQIEGMSSAKLDEVCVLCTLVLVYLRWQMKQNFLNIVSLVA